jgi:hypothetical protein
MDYQAAIREFHIQGLDDQFEVLQHLANIFTVPFESISMLISEDPLLSKMDSDELYAFIKLRADYKVGKAASLNL